MPPTTVLVAAALLMAGGIVYSFSFQPRSSLTIPLISNRGKKALGGALIFVGVCLMAYWFLKIE